MFAFLTRQLSVQSGRDIKPTPDLLAWLAPAMLMAFVWTIAAAIDVMGLPGDDFATSFLRGSLWLQVFTMVYVTVPLIVCALSDPVEIRLAMRTSIVSLASFLPRVIPRILHFLETLVGHPTAKPILATPEGVRPRILPQPSILALGFSPGVSPQIE